MLLVPFPCPFLVCGALVHCFKLGISLVQFCFIIKNEHGVLWGFFLPISPVDHGGNKGEHRVSLLKISRPNIATNPVAQRALPLLIRRTFHAAAGCQLSPRFLPVLTPAHVHLGQCRLLTLALLLPGEGQKPALFHFGPVPLCSLILKESVQLSEPPLCKSICCFSLCLNPGVLPAFLVEVVCCLSSDTHSFKSETTFRG